MSPRHIPEITGFDTVLFRFAFRAWSSLLAAAVLLPLVGISLAAQQLGTGSTIEARMLTRTGTRTSRVGDPVQAVVIAPVLALGQAAIPQGSILTGWVDDVEPLGFGLKRRTASIHYQFDTVKLPEGGAYPIRTRLVEVETAKERVDSRGFVGGIYPTANFSSTLSLYVLPFLYVTPVVGAPAMGIKSLIARAPDPEISFPPGTELLLKLTAPASIPVRPASPVEERSFSRSEIARLRQIVNEPAWQQAYRTGHERSDLVNIIFLGTADQIDRAFKAAGWSSAQGRSALTAYRLYQGIVERMGYEKGPMDRLLLDGARPAAAYEKGLNTFSKRHHLRIWRDPDANGTVWLSAASEDVSYKLRKMRLTHSTDRYIDNERAKVANDLSFAGCVDAQALLPRYSLIANPNGVSTDGSVAVIRLNECREPRSMPKADEAPRQTRLMRGLIAVRNDLARSNIVFLAYNTTRLFKLTHHSSPVETLAAPSSGTTSAKSHSEDTWIRPSLLSRATLKSTTEKQQ